MSIRLEARQMVAKCGPAEGTAGQLQVEKDGLVTRTGYGMVWFSVCKALNSMPMGILDESKLLSLNARYPLLLYTSYIITLSLLAPAIYGLALTKSTPFWMFFFKSVFRLNLHRNE